MLIFCCCFGPIATCVVAVLLVAVVGADLNETLVLVGWLGNPSIRAHTHSLKGIAYVHDESRLLFSSVQTSSFLPMRQQMSNTGHDAITKMFECTNGKVKAGREGGILATFKRKDQRAGPFGCRQWPSVVLHDSEKTTRESFSAIPSRCISILTGGAVQHYPAGASIIDTLRQHLSIQAKVDRRDRRGEAQAYKFRAT